MEGNGGGDNAGSLQPQGSKPGVRPAEIDAPGPDIIPAEKLNGCWCGVCFPLGLYCFWSCACGPDDKNNCTCSLCFPIPIPDGRERIPGTNNFRAVTNEIHRSQHETCCVEHYSSDSCLSWSKPTQRELGRNLCNCAWFFFFALHVFVKSAIVVVIVDVDINRCAQSIILLTLISQ